jgi:hypothetical protein
MPVEYYRPDNLQTRIFQSFVNLTEENPTTYPALTTVRIDNLTKTDNLTAYYIYDQYAIRVKS